jgi:hypothetical protein
MRMQYACPVKEGISSLARKETIGETFDTRLFIVRATTDSEEA